ncbi:BgTH12-07928 [Blumeria graminis f. sp. triticale]|uniref:Putative tRNA (cytidine(32)/guanosine(34)-2'-O)-methyltransferase n=3 Tax=Blumeria graminis TaxID=34373 RepID=A0A061HM11_BLUGR|nr:2'-O-ribose methyltransferase [Blumeria graminis f. sp. tritici 96224]CAD6502528.1 BgTH12-07928 [Blumeria graminis f. sp. triticale]VDB87902.1 Bgt-4914 [Blumeria graminis f. sp. tritici]
MGKSSKDKRDAYYRLAKEQGWRARSAFKLLQLDEEFDLFKGVSRVVDLCAAPGSWSQVLSRVLIQGEKFGRAAWEDEAQKSRQELLGIFGTRRIDKQNYITPQSQPRGDIKIVAIDLQPMSPLQGIKTLRADITHPATLPLLLSALDPTYSSSSNSQHASNPVDLVLSDGAPDVTGLHDLDIYIQSQLLFAALNMALCVLRPGGKFVAKIFRGRNVDLLFAQLKIFFERVIVAKPRSSRASSIEAFIVCLNFSPPENFKPSLKEPIGAGDSLMNLIKSQAEQRPIFSMALLQNPLTSQWSLPVENPIAKNKSDRGRPSLEEHQSNVVKDGRWIAPFLACGDLSAFDADASYILPKDRIALDPIQPPTAPPYKRALEMRKIAGGAYGKTACS